MRDDTKYPSEEEKETAIDDFCEKNKFTESTVPEGGETGRIYTTKAWQGSEDENVNMDRNKYALFVFVSKVFTDPGLSVRNSYNEVQELSETNYVKRVIEYYTMDSSQKTIIGKFKNATYNSWDDKMVGKSGENTISALSGLSVRPDVYEIEYTYQDSVVGEVTAKRPLVILPHIGDTDINSVINGLDSNIINNRTTNPLPDEKTADVQRSGALYAHRVADTDNNSVINGLDSNIIDNRTVKALVEFYNVEILTTNQEGGKNNETD
jgi:hypothetical protein